MRLALPLPQRPGGPLRVEPGSGGVFSARTGQTFRVSLPDGPQVVDMNLFNPEEPRETFGASVTRTLEGTHLSVESILFSCPPWERALCRITEDTLSDRIGPGARPHDLLFGRCSRAYRERVYGLSDQGCQEILETAAAQAGIAAGLVHDAFNLFMTTGVGPDGRPFFIDSVARAGDYVELQALADCIVVISACPGRSSGPTHHAVEVHRADGE
jgi:uncharacterized protein